MIEHDENDDPADKPAADEGLTIDEGDDALDIEDDDEDEDDDLDFFGGDDEEDEEE